MSTMLSIFNNEYLNRDVSSEELIEIFKKLRRVKGEELHEIYLSKNKEKIIFILNNDKRKKFKINLRGLLIEELQTLTKKGLYIAACDDKLILTINFEKVVLSYDKWVSGILLLKKLDLDGKIRWKNTRG